LLHFYDDSEVTGLGSLCAALRPPSKALAMAHAFDPAVSAAAAHRDRDTPAIRQARIARAAGDAAEVQLEAMASGRPLKPVAPASRCCGVTPTAPGCIWSP